MDQRFSISIKLTVGAFAFTAYLIVILAIAYNNIPPEPLGCGTVATSVQPELEAGADHPGYKIFKANCMTCHRMNKKLVGPALAGVLERRDSLWVINMIRNSSQLIASGDPAAVELFREYNGTVMTSFTSLSNDDLKALLEYLRIVTEESKIVVDPLPHGDV
jgi:mono/diheme cytochrome c family protein